MKKQLLSILTVLSLGTAIAQIPNNGFETWGSTFGAPQEPTSYVSANILASPLISPSNPTSVTQGTGVNAFAGNYSAKVTTVRVTTNPSGGTIPDTIGLLLLGTVNISGTPSLKSGTPWTTRLQSIDFAYKYTPVNGDNGVVIAYLTKHTSGNFRDTLATAYYPFTSAVSSFTSVSAPFIDNIAFPSSTAPDTLHIYFLSSARPWLDTPALPVNPQIGSALWVDAAVAVPVGLKAPIKLFGNETKVYPNPATNFINISSTNEEAATAELYDITGNKISTGMFDDKKVRFETSTLAEGLYIYSVKNKDKEVIATGKVNIAK